MYPNILGYAQCWRYVLLYTLGCNILFKEQSEEDILLTSGAANLDGAVSLLMMYDMDDGVG